MAKEKKYMLIEEEALRRLIISDYQMSYTVMLLSYICVKHNLNTSLTLTEACCVLNLSARQVADAKKRCQLRTIGQVNLLSAYDLAMLAAQLHRKRTMTPLREVPRYVRAPEHPEETEDR